MSEDADRRESLAAEIGELLARKLFEQRGNRGAIHLREVELAEICKQSAKLGIEHANPGP